MAHKRNTRPSTDPAQILRYRDRQYAAELMAAALVHLDFFSWLQENPGVDTETLLAHFKFAPRPANDKTGPLPAAEYSALLMSITQGKCYTPAEYGEMLEALGFKVGPYEDTIADRGFMTAVKR